MVKWWLLFRQAPRYVLAGTIIAVSTFLFAGWLLFHSKTKPREIGLRDDAAVRAAIREKSARAEARIDYLFLADDDLYDAGTGDCLFKNWLKGDHPTRLFYEQEAKKILGEFPQGFARYGFDGTREATMMLPQSPPAMIPGRKQVVFAKEKNIWIADIDWQKFEFTNQRQVTTMGVFYEQHFAENVQLLTSKTLLVRNVNNLLRVNLENGDVHPSRLPLGEIAKRRSPDSKWVAGFLNNQFYCYDVDADTTKTIPVGRNGISDLQWIDNDKCICLAARQQIVTYDRPSNILAEVATLPFACFKIGEPSPDGRFIFAAGGIDGRNGVLVDLERKNAQVVRGGAGIAWVSNDTFAFSRDVPDSELRGMWLQQAGKRENRISSDPLSGNSVYTRLIFLPPPKFVLFVAGKTMIRIHAENNWEEMSTRLSSPPKHLMSIQQL